MTERRRLRAVRGFSYPADERSWEIIDAAGGRSKLTPEQAAKVRIAEVAAGAWCDELPARARGQLLRKKAVEYVAVAPKATSKTSTKGRDK